MVPNVLRMCLDVAITWEAALLEPFRADVILAQIPAEPGDWAAQVAPIASSK